jgi:hypothetical protein
MLVPALLAFIATRFGTKAFLASTKPGSSRNRGEEVAPRPIPVGGCAGRARAREPALRRQEALLDAVRNGTEG